MKRSPTCIVDDINYVFCITNFSDLLLKTTEYLLLPKRRPPSALSKVLSRKASSAQQVMYAVGGMRRREALKSAEKFDVKEGRWKTIGEVDL